MRIGQTTGHQICPVCHRLIDAKMEHEIECVGWKGFLFGRWNKCTKVKPLQRLFIDGKDTDTYITEYPDGEFHHLVLNNETTSISMWAKTL